MDGEQRRILIIDDNEDMAEAIYWLLTGKGHAALTATSGALGLSATASFKPHVVFLDLGMPVMDGYEVARRMRADEALAQPFLVAFTAWSDEDAKLRVAEAGFDMHLVKTAPIDTLLAVIEGSASAGSDGGCESQHG